MPKYLSFAKIAKSVKSGKAQGKYFSKQTVFLLAFELENGICFCVNKSEPHGDSRRIEKIATYKLRIFDKKDGTKGFNFYKLRNTFPRIASPSDLSDRFTHRVKSSESLRSQGIKSKQVSGFSKTSSKKLYSFIRKFCNKHKVNIKWMSKDPIALMYNLCYPGTIGLKDKSIVKLMPNSLLKKPIWKALCTNGSLTKRLLIEQFNTSPEHAVAILNYARMINQLYGLDKAQQFIRSAKTGACIDYSISYHHRAKNLHQIIKKKFARLSYEQMIRSINQPTTIVADTIDMMNRSIEEGNELPEYVDIRDLHDKLSLRYRRMARLAQSQREQRRRESAIPTYDILTTLSEEWDDDKFKLVLPEKGMDLIIWSERMNNCVASYIDQVLRGDYYILGVEEEGQLKYNIGFSIYRGKFQFSQWSGYRNSSVEIEDQERLNRQFEKVEIRTVRNYQEVW